MDRKPSTTLPRQRYSTPCVRQPMDRAAWAALFDVARKEFGKEELGLVGLKDGRAWFQVWGDATPYSIVLTDDELAMFHV